MTLFVAPQYPKTITADIYIVKTHKTMFTDRRTLDEILEKSESNIRDIKDDDYEELSRYHKFVSAVKTNHTYQYHSENFAKNR